VRPEGSNGTSHCPAASEGGKAHNIGYQGKLLLNVGMNTKEGTGEFKGRFKM